ncbi:MAG TPA: hypothetical protein VMV92_07855 [Streptosporangiaceae bacterium]|nr:hypothetical protein [Streptosporangiaceae bacterium]
MSARAAAYQAQITGGAAGSVYWAFFDGLELIDLADVSMWRSRKTKVKRDLPALRFLGGIGRKR